MDNEKLYEDMKPKEKFEVLWAESGLANRPGAENLWQQMVALGFFEKPATVQACPGFALHAALWWMAIKSKEAEE